VGSTDRLEIHGRIFAAPINFELERKPVALIKGRDSGAFDRRNVNECIGLAVIALDEAEALHCVEEFDRALSFLAGQLALRAAIAAAAALYRHRLTFDPEVGRRNPSAAIDKREFERLPVREIGKSGLFDSGYVDEHVVAAVIANDEAESLLGIEKLHHTLAFADDLRRHPAAAAASESAAAAAAAGKAAAAAATISAKAATIAISAIASEAAALLESAAVAVAVLEEPVPLVPAATATVAFTPSVETHARQKSLCPH
jgi:hypothetical protein